MSNKCDENEANTFFKGIRKHQNNLYQKRTKLLILIVDSCLSALFAMHKKVLKIKCKISNITSDKDFHLTNLKKIIR